MAVQFKNPFNGYVEEVSNAPLWSLLFGFFYFAAKGVWTHAAAGAVLAFFTFGLSWIIYPFFANQIMRTHYLRRGWIDASTTPPASPASSRVSSDGPALTAGHDGINWKLVAAAFFGSMFLFGLFLGISGKQRPEQQHAETRVVSQAPDCSRLKYEADHAEEWAGSARLALGQASMTTRIQAEDTVRKFETDALNKIAEWTRRCR